MLPCQTTCLKEWMNGRGGGDVYTGRKELGGGGFNSD